MAMRKQTCWSCGRHYEFYQQWSIVPPCPECGAGPDGSPAIVKGKAIGYAKDMEDGRERRKLIK
jgi:hypothetical protein